MNINTISRRRFVVGCVAAVSATCPPRVSGQTAQRKANKPTLRLVREFTNGAGLLAASPNGRRLCLAFVQGGPVWRLDVIETGTWDVLSSNKFTANFGFNASFFASGEALYVNTIGPNKGFFLDLRSGELQERALAPTDPFGYTALTESTLLAENRDGSLARISLPEYKEIGRVSEPQSSSLLVSSNRERLLRTCGNEEHSIACYRTIDLSRLWARRIDIPGARWDLLHNNKGLVDPTMSADGGSIAVAAIDTPQWEDQKRFYVAILNGDTGAEIRRLPINAAAAHAISPDGELLAVGKRRLAGGNVELTFEVRDTVSGAVLAAATHGLVPSSRWQAGTALFSALDHGLAFTSDGAYLTSSGANLVKVWELT